MTGRILLHAGYHDGDRRVERLAELSREIAKTVPQSAILLATESDGLEFGTLPPNADYVRVPIDEPQGKGTGPQNTGLRFEILRATARRFPPDLFVLDTNAPAGIEAWMTFLAELRRHVPACSIVLVWDGPWQNGGSAQLPGEVAARFDEIWVLSDSESAEKSTHSGVGHFVKLGAAAGRVSELLEQAGRKGPRLEDTFPHPK